MRQCFMAILLLVSALSLAGCGGEEAQATAVVGLNSAVTTATAVSRAANATTTAALGQVPVLPIPTVVLPGSASAPPLPSGSGAPSLPSALPAAPSSAGTSPPPIIATVLPSGAPSPSGSRPPIGLPSSRPSAQPSGTGQGVALLPAGFPLPSQYTVVSSTETSGQIIVILSVSSSKDAYDFYKGALPGAGYQVTDQGNVTVPGGAFISNLTISNATYDGSLAFTPGGLNGQTVTIQLRSK